MKNTVLITTLALSIATGTALSAGNESHKGGHGPKMSFEEVDANKDGKLTPEELALHAQARFNATDTNGDGQISEAELRARMQGKAAERVEKRVTHIMERRDANGDGQLSMDEMKPKHMGRMMKKADTDGDGAISKAEFDVMKEKRAKHRKGKHKGNDKDKS